MPLYEFACAACGGVFEEICAADADAPACPACGAKGAMRQISAPSPLKTGAFPYPPTGKVHPLGKGLAPGCGHSCN